MDLPKSVIHASFIFVLLRRVVNKAHALRLNHRTTAPLHHNTGQGVTVGTIDTGVCLGPERLRTVVRVGTRRSREGHGDAVSFC